MSTITFDTLKTSRNLQAAGIAEDHAEAIVNSIAEALTDTAATKADIAEIKSDIAGLGAATKSDIVALKADITRLEATTKADIVALEATTKAMIESLRSEMHRALFVQGATVVALVVGFLKLI